MNALTKTSAALAVGILSTFASAASAQSLEAQSIDGRWDASLIEKNTVIPFRLDISGSGPTLKATFYDGWKANETTTAAKFENGVLTLELEHYLTAITATYKNGELTGTLGSTSRQGSSSYGFEAKPYVAPTNLPTDYPNIAGTWEIPLDKPTAKGEKTQRFVVQQDGPNIAATTLRVDGDSGSHVGTYKDGKWVISHFDGSRPGQFEVKLNSDGTLEISQGGARRGAAATGGEDAGPAKLIAYRPEVARAKGLPEPENYLTHTTVRDPNEPFAFSFPDVNGKIVSNTDPKFAGKVVLAIVTGTWCPNCHDEAQYLVQLYKKYHDKGLEIVALDFEEAEQQGSLERVHAFVKQYGVPYEYLIAGAPVEMWEKVPQAVNLNTWPATVFVGRDGLVKGVHSGFASPAAGVFNDELKAEFTSKVEQLLAQKPVTGTPVASKAGF
jgi:thiol-disulfide isomerase/thioredoxin